VYIVRGDREGERNWNGEGDDTD